MKPILHTINEACQALRIGRTALYDAINSGELVARKRGSRTLIHENDLNQFAESLPKKASAA
jgi:excisionase family DNA binding protein